MPITCRDCRSPIPEDRINPDSGVACCPACGMLWRCAMAPDRPAGPALPTAGMPQGLSLTVDEGRLRIEYPVRNKQTMPIGIFILVVAAIWWGFLLSFGLGRGHGGGIFRFVSIAFSLPFVAMGIIEIAAAMFILFGRVQVNVEPSLASRRWALGPFAYTRRAALDETAVCRWHERPFFVTPQTRPTRHQRPRLRPPLELVSDSGSLGFGAIVAPEHRSAIAESVNAFLDRAHSQPGALTIPRGQPPRRAACPHCASDLGPASVSVREMRLACPRCGHSAPLEFERTRPVAALGWDEDAPRAVPRPPKTKIIIERPRPDQMVIFMPKHGFRGAPGFMMFFSIVWSVFTLAIFGVMIASMISGGRAESGTWPAIPMGILFIGVGVTMFYFAVKGALSKKLLSIERDRVVLRTTFMNRRKDVEAETGPGQMVTQVEAYRQNDNPVYKLSFVGTKVAFGSEMDQAEKDWLECEINRFLKGLDERQTT